MKRIGIYVLVAAIPALGACGSNFSVEPPRNFVHLEDESSQYDFRASTADGVVFAVREVENERGGTLEFWATAIKNRLRLNGGYALVDEREVRVGSGHTGLQLRFGRDQRGTAFRYWLSVFVTEDHVHLVEVGGREEVFQDAEESVAAAIAAIEIH
ncbi:MAG: serine/threonine protein kinase [Myxococcota bacterium]